ncbi:hypothetical protein H2200_013190 [Cladophialophora chaetospira]|uniref:Uncharacterized protein n=1 Tax=Cladophialophora chaetospira TaxID=386627 RepID=A0AA38WWB3_9EURO|nr:hypothetical protein H2200_013190 [Cladophialophora chaetospira]
MTTVLTIRCKDDYLWCRHAGKLTPDSINKVNDFYYSLSSEAHYEAIMTKRSPKTAAPSRGHPKGQPPPNHNRDATVTIYNPSNDRRLNLNLHKSARIRNLGNKMTADDTERLERKRPRPSGPSLGPQKSPLARK